MANGKSRLRGAGIGKIFRTNRPTSVTNKFKHPAHEMPGTMQKKLGKR